MEAQRRQIDVQPRSGVATFVEKGVTAGGQQINNVVVYDKQ